MRAKQALKEIAHVSSGEFYHAIPKGYVAGKTKYVVMTGSVMSGVGKGTINSCLCKLLQDRGFKVEPIKLEAYLNVDAGTLNPFRHGEVFVLDDGTETDLDLGTYERMLDKNMSKENFVTSGSIYKSIIEKERAGKYLGRDVQFIPHVTGEIKGILRNLTMKTKADFIVIEIGGTVGDYENMFALEAIRELIYEEGRENVCFINVTYIIEPKALGEHKSKAAQLGIKKVMELGIQPDIVICRSETPITQKIKEKISLNVSVPLDNVFGVDTIRNIYELPLKLRLLSLDFAVLNLLDWWKRAKKNGNQSLEEWTKNNTVSEKAGAITIGIAGKYTGSSDTYISILNALEHCSAAINKKIIIKWLETTDFETGKQKTEEALGEVDGIIVPGGFGSRGIEGKIMVAKYCRENNVPYLGLCLGFQIAVIEFARNVCGIKKANSTEFDPETTEPVIDILPEQKKIEGLGGNMRLGGKDVEIKHGTMAFKLYGAGKARERFRHRFECNPKYIELLEKHGMFFSGKAPNQPIMQILELPNHKFFMGTQFHPEFTSRPLKPNPVFLGFAKECAKK